MQYERVARWYLIISNKKSTNKLIIVFENKND